MNATAVQKSDPYRAWLNVRETHRPLNAYQLLGLPPLESNPEKIRSAASRQRAALDTHRGEAHTAAWRRVRSELEEAAGTLLDPDRKAAYDERLQSSALGRHGRGGADGSAVDPASETGLHCPRCGAAAHDGRRFCGGCGLRLWISCPQCGTLTFAGEKFCGTCGANFAAALEQLAAQFETGAQRARQLRAACQYDEAIQILGDLTAVEHAQLAEQAAAAKRLLEEIVEERDRKVAWVEQTVRRAEELAGAGRYAEAAAQFESIPGPLRTEALDARGGELRDRVAEIAELESGLSEAIREKRWHDVLPKLNRLLTLQPTHVQAQKLARQFDQRLCRMAQQRIAGHRYEEAARLLEQLPESERSAEAAGLLHRAQELAWMVRDLQTAPVADRTLLAVARRLSAEAPSDAHVVKLCGEIERRVQGAAAQPGGSPRPWARPPAQSRVGRPVDWLTGSRRIQGLDSARWPALADHPGCFFVACGLALQALGLAQVPINLTPAEDGVLRRIVKMVPKWSGRGGWGLDLGSSGLKAVRLDWDQAQKAVVLAGCDLVEHRKLLSQAADERESLRLIAETLDVFLSRNSVKGDPVCVGLPGPMVLSRMVTLPPITPAKVDAAVLYEARQQFKGVVGDLVVDYHVIDKIEGDLRANRDHDVVLVVTKRSRAAALLSACRDAGLTVDAFQSDCIALHNFLWFDQWQASDGNAESQLSEAPPLGIVDVGGDSLNVVFSSPHLIWFRTVSLGADRYTRSLAQSLNVGFQEAERLKRAPADAPSISQWGKACEPAFEDVVEEIRRAQEAFAEAHRAQRIEKFLACGGGMLVHGLLRHLRGG